MVTRVLVSPGDVVAVEEPGYPLARDVFASYGARVVPVRGRRGGAGRRRPAADDPARVHHAVAPVPLRPAAVARPTPGAARLRGSPPVRGDRGRLRQRVPLHRAADGDAALDGRRGPGALPRQLLQVTGPRAAGRLPGGARAAPGRAARRAPADRWATSSVPEQAALARFLERRALRASPAQGPRGVRRAAGAGARSRARSAGRPPRAGAVPGRAARHDHAARPGRRRHRRGRRAAEQDAGHRGAVVVRRDGAAARHRAGLRRRRTPPRSSRAWRGWLRSSTRSVTAWRAPTGGSGCPAGARRRTAGSR